MHKCDHCGDTFSREGHVFKCDGRWCCAECLAELEHGLIPPETTRRPAMPRRLKRLDDDDQDHG